MTELALHVFYRQAVRRHLGALRPALRMRYDHGGVNVTINYKTLSRTISYALRHRPERYDLAPDEEGWVPVAALLAALRPTRPAWRTLQPEDLERMIAGADKQRFELRDGRIRALYGHSLPNKIEKTTAEPPAILYHGTAPDIAPLILAEGLKPMRRQYVHLSIDPETAQAVGKRKAPAPVILTIQAGAAYRSGVTFYAGNNAVWLAEYVPPNFIQA